MTRSIDTLVYIAQQIGGMIDILELVNESAGFFSSEWASVTRSFFSNGYAAVRNAVGDTLNIMIGDAFLGVDVGIHSAQCLFLELLIRTVMLGLGRILDLPYWCECLDGQREYSGFFSRLMK